MRSSGTFLLAAALGSACGGTSRTGPSGGAAGAAGAAGAEGDPCEPTLEYRGDVTVYRDADLDVLRGYGVLFGNLRVEDWSYPYDYNVGDLGALGCLGRVDGQVIIKAPNLPTLAGLENLTTVTGSLTLDCYDEPETSENRVMETLRGIEALESIGGDLTITGLDALVSLRGLTALEAIGQSLVITGNAVLPTCEAEQLRDSVGTANIGGDVQISGNDDTGVCSTL